MSYLDNIDNSLSVLYDFVYNTNTNECYNIQPIIINELTIDDIRKPKSYSITHIFKNTKLVPLGKINNKYYFIRKSNFDSILCIGEYDSKIFDIDLLDRNENTNMAMLYIISELVLTEKNIHVILPVANMQCKIEDINKIAELSDIKFKNTLYINVLECYTETTTLRKFIEINELSYYHWVVIIFQIFYTLYRLSVKLIDFVHNDLTLDSIFIVKTDTQDKYIKYKIDDIVYHLPNIGISCKIGNFDKSYTRSYQKERVTEKMYQYKDIQMFIYSIYSTNKIKDEETNSFIKEIVPKEFLIQNVDISTYTGANMHVLTCKNILLNNLYFTKLVKNKDDITSVTPTEFSESDKPLLLGRKI